MLPLSRKLKLKMPEGRFDRQFRMPEIRGGGQVKLAAAHIAVIGAGGLGSSLLFALAGTGIGHLLIIDQDIVSISNLNRQFLYTPEDIGRQKAKIAAERLIDYNPQMDIESVCVSLDDKNSVDLLKSSDLIISAVDSMASRYIINRAACELGLPLIDGAVNAFSGYLSLIEPAKSACFECQEGIEKVYSSNTSGYMSGQAAQVIGTTPAVIGAMQADMAVAFILGCNSSSSGYRYYYNGKDQSIEAVSFLRDPLCRVCSKLQ